MYIPRSYAETDISRLHDFMQQYNFAVLFSGGRDMMATHLPFILDATRGEQGTLVAHLAKANPHWKLLQADQEVLVVFQGPHAYISPSWYASSGNVPTWNYAAVHAYGKPVVIHDLDSIREMVLALVALHGGSAYLPDPFPEQMLQAVVGLEIPISRLEGKFKFNQNKSAADQQGVVDALIDAEDSVQQAVAHIMQANLAALQSSS